MQPQSRTALRKALYVAGGDYHGHVATSFEGVAFDTVGRDIMALEALGEKLAAFAEAVADTAARSSWVQERPDPRVLVDYLADALDDHLESAALEIVRAAARVAVS